MPAALECVDYPGYNDINMEWFGGHVTYYALQTFLQKRFSHGLTFGVAYTWSKPLGVGSFDRLVPNNDARNYEPQSIDRPGEHEPDHRQVHQVAKRTHSLAGDARVFLKCRNM